jgi:hypothetical protein
VRFIGDVPTFVVVAVLRYRAIFVVFVGVSVYKAVCVGRHGFS